jgi:outer membrane lipoprotein-sorting protein
MPAGKSLRIAITGTVLAGIAAMGAAQSSDPAQILMRSMQRTYDVNVVVELLQRDPMVPGTFQRVKVERTGSGHSRRTILQPLRMLGVTQVDDGDRLRMYLPDRNRIIDQDSALKEPCQAEARIRLARKNYTLRLDTGPRIAGRQTVVVVATPRHRDMDGRKYYIDRETDFPLRLETISGSDVRVMYDTKDIQFPARLDPKLFSLQPVGNVEVQRYERPQRVTAQQARQLVGFLPVLPESLPLGFEVDDVQFSVNRAGNHTWRSIVVRMSDGLARATVYQWRASDRIPVDAFEESSTAENNGVSIMVVSELPQRVRERLLQAFVTQTVDLRPDQVLPFYSGLRPTGGRLGDSMEPVPALWAFAGLEGLAFTGRSLPAQAMAGR